MVEVEQIIKAGGVYKFLLDNFDFETKPRKLLLLLESILSESSE
jgi:hypothetical protein